jgi:hypothetical protein
MRLINVARLGLPLVQNAHEWESEPIPQTAREAQRTIA